MKQGSPWAALFLRPAGIGGPRLPARSAERWAKWWISWVASQGPASRPRLYQQVASPWAAAPAMSVLGCPHHQHPRRARLPHLRQGMLEDGRRRLGHLHLVRDNERLKTSVPAQFVEAPALRAG